MVTGNLKNMSNDVMDELMDVKMETKPDSLSWTSTCIAEEEMTL